ncbi:ATP-binding protein [Streptomyces sp. NPDC002611]
MRTACGELVGSSACRFSSVRRNVRGRLERWGIGELADDAVLIVSELLANALRYGEPPVRLSLTLRGAGGGQRVRIGVTDAGTPFSSELVRAKWRHPSAHLSGGGRGLRLVDALACDWGDLPDGLGHTVWAELPCGTDE